LFVVYSHDFIFYSKFCFDFICWFSLPLLGNSNQHFQVIFILIFSSATLGALCAFFIGKFLLRNVLVGRLNGSAKFQAIDRAIRQNGFKIVLLLRLIPITPFNFLNYILGVTNIPIHSFIFATLSKFIQFFDEKVGMIPEVLVLVHLGTFAKSIKSIVQGKSGPSWGIELLTYTLSAILVFGVFFFVIWIAKNELKNSLMVEEELEQHNQHLEIMDDEEVEEVDIDKFSKSDDKYEGKLE
jgi:uncharacterized membrane protein YdjX (TVP38/TMEM64 family)